MRQKLIIAWKMNTFANSSPNPINQKIYRKCLRAYIGQCIMLGKNEIKLKFGSEYYDSFYLRFKDWVEYIDNKFLWVPVYKFLPQKSRPGIINYYIERGVDKPIHIKHHIHINESILEYFCRENGFEIVDEHLGSLETIYYIKKKEEKRD